MAFVEHQQIVNVDVRHAVAVGHEKRTVVKIWRDSLYSAARHGFKSRVNYGHSPFFGALVVDDYFIVLSKVKRNVGGVQKIVRKPFLYGVLLVACANDEVVDSVSRVQLHYVPQNRHAAYFDHGLWLELRFLGNPRSKAARKNNSFHNLIYPFLRFFIYTEPLPFTTVETVLNNILISSQTER